MTSSLALRDRLTRYLPSERALANVATAASLAIGLATVIPPAARAIRAPTVQAHVVFGEPLESTSGSYTLGHRPTGRVALYVGGVRQPDESYEVNGRTLVVKVQPEAGEKVSVDYAY